jgi:hypothetical protein
MKSRRRIAVLFAYPQAMDAAQCDAFLFVAPEGITGPFGLDGKCA